MAKKIKIVALLPLLAFGLPQSEGQVAEVEKKQADEIIEAGYAKMHVASAKVDAGVESDEPDADQDKATE